MSGTFVHDMRPIANSTPVSLLHAFVSQSWVFFSSQIYVKWKNRALGRKCSWKDKIM
jgi:hypothetical protein